MGKLSRDKGARFELEVVHLARAHGLKAERMLAPEVGTCANGGIAITPTFANQPWLGHCDGQHVLPAWLANALDGHEFVALRTDCGEAVAVIPLRTLLELMQ